MSDSPVLPDFPTLIDKRNPQYGMEKVSDGSGK